MDSRMHFTFSDTIAGSVVAYQADEDTFTLRTIDGREFEVALTNQTFAEVIRNLGEAYIDATRLDARHARPRPDALRLRDLLPRGRRHRRSRRSTSSSSAARSHDFVFERPDWWVDQIREIADFYIRAQFPDGNIDFAEYRTRLNLEGEKLPGTRQETDTISRMVYGFASAYLLTGEDRFLEAAEKGTEYLREHMRTVDAGEGVAYWVHGDRHRRREGEEDPRLRVRRRLRRDPGLRADLRARRPDADLPRHGRPADPERHRHDDRALQPLLPRPRRRRLLLAPRPDHVRPAQRVARQQPVRARTGTRSATTRRRT